jgi:hypothetical protein
MLHEDEFSKIPDTSLTDRWWAAPDDCPGEVPAWAAATEAVIKIKRIPEHKSWQILGIIHPPPGICMQKRTPA